MGIRIVAVAGIVLALQLAGVTAAQAAPCAYRPAH